MFDRARSILTLFAAVFVAAVALIVHIGLTGFVGSAISSRTNHLAPAGYTAAIWVVIAGLAIAFGAYQALPARRTSSLLRSLGWAPAVALTATAAWLFLRSTPFIVQAVVLWALAVGTLSAIMERTLRQRLPLSLAERWLVLGTFSVTAGWAVASGMHDLMRLSIFAGLSPAGSAAQALAVALLGGTALAVAVGAFVMRGNFAFSGAVAWGFVGIAVARFMDRTTGPSGALGVFALFGAIVLIVLPLLAKLPALRPTLSRPVPPRQSLA